MHTAFHAPSPLLFFMPVTSYECLLLQIISYEDNTGFKSEGERKNTENSFLLCIQLSGDLDSKHGPGGP